MNEDANTRIGWKCSQVERLTELPRRDIQRACYNGKGGADILQPQDSAWGRRNYSVHDLAYLMLVKLNRDKGLTLPQIKHLLTHLHSSSDVAAALSEWECRLSEELDGALTKLNKVKLLKCMLSCDPDAEDKTSQQLLTWMIDQAICRDILDNSDPSHLTSSRGTEFGSSPHFGKSPQGPMASAESTAALLDRILDTPGMDLAMDLWGGPGSFDAIAEQPRNTKDADENIQNDASTCDGAPTCYAQPPRPHARPQHPSTDSHEKLPTPCTIVSTISINPPPCKEHHEKGKRTRNRQFRRWQVNAHQCRARRIRRKDRHRHQGNNGGS